MIAPVRPLVLIPTVVGAAAIAAAHWTAQVPRGILIDLLVLAGLAGAAGASLSRPGATWPRRAVWTVDPFRRLVLYPFGLRTLQRRWQAAWPAGDMHEEEGG